MAVLSAALACALSSMESSQQKRVRTSAALCAGEQEYLLQRKQVAAQALSALGFSCSAEEVPHVAMLGSGGGQRAAVSLVGSLSQLAQDGLLDAVLYLGGVSGSTWSMAPLYSDPEWSTRLDLHMASLLRSQVDHSVVLSWFKETAQREDFSLTDAWGALTSAGIMKQWDTRKLSEEANRNATNPYPIYGAIEKFCFNNGPVQGKWLELSPHEAGFTELDMFVDTSLLGSSFRGGALVEQKPEMDMIQLQGILGCAPANEKMEDYIPAWLNEPADLDRAAREYLLSYNGITTFINMTKSYVTDDVVLRRIEELQARLHEHINQNKSAVLESQNPEQREQQFKQWTVELWTVVQDWSQTLPDGPTKLHVSLLVQKLLPIIVKWEWGTVKNFLYKSEEESVPECLSSAEHLHLVDAGMLVNVGYPSFLGPRRDIDLLIAPEYSAGDMFETLTLARDYAAQVQKPFPTLDDRVLQEEKDWPRDCYVFEGNGTAPTIVFMPLFNRNNCKDAAEWAQRMDQFATFQKSFSPDMIQFLMDTAKANTRSCKETLLREIGKALQRRRDKLSQTKQ